MKLYFSNKKQDPENTPEKEGCAEVKIHHITKLANNKYLISKSRKYKCFLFGTWHTLQEAQIVVEKLEEQKFPTEYTTQKTGLKGEKYREFIRRKLGINSYFSSISRLKISKNKEGYSLQVFNQDGNIYHYGGGYTFKEMSQLKQKLEEENYPTKFSEEKVRISVNDYENFLLKMLED